MPGTKRLGAVLVILAAAAALYGCGSDEISGEIPAGNATDLTSALASVRAEIEAGCTDPEQAQDQAQAFVDEVNELPQDPAGELKAELQRAADNLRTLVESECASTEPPATTQSTTPSTSSTTQEPEPTTTDETTTTTTTTTEETTPEDGGGPPGGGPPGGGPPGGGPPGQDGGTGGTGGPSDEDGE